MMRRADDAHRRANRRKRTPSQRAADLRPRRRAGDRVRRRSAYRGGPGTVSPCRRTRSHKARNERRRRLRQFVNTGEADALSRGQHGKKAMTISIPASGMIACSPCSCASQCASGSAPSATAKSEQCARRCERGAGLARSAPRPVHIASATARRCQIGGVFGNRSGICWLRAERAARPGALRRGEPWTSVEFVVEHIDVTISASDLRPHRWITWRLARAMPGRSAGRWQPLALCAARCGPAGEKET